MTYTWNCTVDKLYSQIVMMCLHHVLYITNGYTATVNSIASDSELYKQSIETPGSTEAIQISQGHHISTSPGQ